MSCFVEKFWLLSHTRQSQGPDKNIWQLWKYITDELKHLSEHKFNVTQYAVRDRFKLLSEKFKKKMAAKAGASGINPKVSELDVLVEEILAKEKAYNEGHIGGLASKKRKEELDKENADEISLKVMETLKETQKRKADCGKDKSGEVMVQR